jgi:predicted DNA-binding ribbon-helix-helix protein
MKSTLISKNVFAPARTSIRLEPAFWDALGDIAHREGISVPDLTRRIAAARREGTLTGAVRVFVLGWYRDEADLLRQPR